MNKEFEWKERLVFGYSEQQNHLQNIVMTKAVSKGNLTYGNKRSSNSETAQEPEEEAQLNWVVS